MRHLAAWTLACFLSGCCCSPFDFMGSDPVSDEVDRRVLNEGQEQMCNLVCMSSFELARDDCGPPDETHPNRLARTVEQETECIELARADRDRCYEECERAPDD